MRNGALTDRPRDRGLFTKGADYSIIIGLRDVEDGGFVKSPVFIKCGALSFPAADDHCH